MRGAFETFCKHRGLAFGYEDWRLARDAWDAAGAELRKPSPCGKPGHTMADQGREACSDDEPGAFLGAKACCRACQREKAAVEAAAKEIKLRFLEMLVPLSSLWELVNNIPTPNHALDLAMAKARREEASLWRKRIVECQLVGFVDERLAALDAEIKELEAK